MAREGNFIILTEKGRFLLPTSHGFRALGPWDPTRRWTQALASPSRVWWLDGASELSSFQKGISRWTRAFTLWSTYRKRTGKIHHLEWENSLYMAIFLMFFFFLCGLMGYEWDVSPLIGLTSFIYPMIWGFNVDLMGSHEHRKLLGGWIFPSDLHGDIWRHWWSGWKTMKMTSRQLSSLEWCWMEGDSSP